MKKFQKFGTEIDVRSFNSKLVLNHEPKEIGDKLSDYLNEYSHGTIIFNIKEAGIEDEVIKIAKQKNKILLFVRCRAPI